MAPMATHTSAQKASKALNNLLHYSPKDQDALLGVLEEYLDDSDGENDDVRT